MKVEEVQRTKKIYSESQDVVVIDLHIQAVSEIISNNPIKTWDEIAHIFQTVQLAYESIDF